MVLRRVVTNNTGLHSLDSNQLQKPELLGQVRNIIRVRHYSIRTEDTYIDWILDKTIYFFHNLRHPKDMGLKR